MAYGPLSIANPEQITDNLNTYKMEGDIRGLPTSIVYNTKVVRPLTPVYDLMKEEGFKDERLRAAVDYLFKALTFRLRVLRLRSRRFDLQRFESACGNRSAEPRDVAL